MRYRMNGFVVAVRCVLLGAVVVVAGCGGGGGGGGGNVRPDPPPAVAPPPPPPPAPVVSAPNPAYSQHLALTNTTAAHQAGFTGQGVRIGVVDSGVMRNHPALAPRVVANLNYVSSPPNNLAIDDVIGHGTAVSQIMAGTPFGQWPGGIAPGAQIISARIISDKEPTDDGSGQGNAVDGALGLKAIHQDLINRGARIMNNSWGGVYWTDPAATAAIADEYRPFIQNNGGLVVFANGNESRANPSSLAALPSQAGVGGSLPAADLERGWLAVAALDSTLLASFSNACGVAMRYCLAAPGTVVVTGTNDSPTSPTYWQWRGTSLAAPQVAGAAALVWQAFPFFSNDNVRQTLLGTATDLGASGIDPVFGNGALNVGVAVRGPQRLDFGDFAVNFDAGTVTFGNDLQGPGALVKGGTGTLVLQRPAFHGSTRINGGVVRANQLGGQVTIGPQGTLQLGAQAQGIENQGRFVATGDAVELQGAYHQTAGSKFAYTVGSPVRILGAVRIDGGDVHVMGVKPGYVWQTRENVLFAMAGMTGRFDGLTAEPGVFLTATLNYDPLVVWLNISRLDVTAAAQSMALSAMSISSAQRVEGAFDQIDNGAGTAPPVDDDFRTGAGAIQQAPTAAAAEKTLASLSGELHATDSAFAMMTIEGNRRSLEARVDTLLATPASGSWADSLEAQRAMAHFDVDADGWMLGHDRRYNDRLTFGAAVSETQGYAWHDERFDRERNRQVEGQLYAAYDLGRGYLLGSLALGRIQRWTQREILLGAQDFRVSADYSQRYATFGLQAGVPLRFGAARVTPYAGAQQLQLDRDGFREDGAVGFGLSAADSSMSATQALLGARIAHDWRAGRWLWTLQGRAEWQHLLSQSGGDIDARFTALEVWSPILGETLDRNVGVFGMGLEARFGRASSLRFDLDSRHDSGEAYSSATATWSVGF